MAEKPCVLGRMFGGYFAVKIFIKIQMRNDRDFVRYGRRQYRPAAEKIVFQLVGVYNQNIGLKMQIIF